MAYPFAVRFRDFLFLRQIVKDLQNKTGVVTRKNKPYKKVPFSKKLSPPPDCNRLFHGTIYEIKKMEENKNENDK